MEHGLHLGGGHLEALDLDHLLRAVGEVHPTLRLEPADVAGAVPAVDERLVVGVLGQVALHERRAPRLDLAHTARLEHGAGVEVDDAELHLRPGQAGRVEPPLVGAVDRVARDHRELAGAVGRQPSHAGPGRDGLRHARGDRRGAPHDVAERREVERLEVRVTGDGEGDRGHRHLEGDPVGLDPAEHLVEVEPAVEPNGGSGLGGGEEVEEAEDVRRGSGHLEAVVGGEPERLHPVRGAGADRAMGVPHRLRQAGGAGAEHEDRLVVRADVARLDRVVAVLRLAVVEVGDRLAEPLAQEVDGGTVGDGVDRCGEGQGVVDLGRLPRRAQQHRGGAELADGVDGDGELHPVGRHHRDAIAWTDASVRQVPREGRAQPLEIRERPLVVVEADGDSIAVRAGRPPERLVEQPAHDPASARARSSSFTTLPVALIGSSSMSSTRRGTL